MKARLPWRRLFAEGVVIAGSILLAFSIDAWWDGRSDKLQEQALLAALSEDFRAANDEFAAVRAGHARVFTSMEQLLTWAEAGSVPEESWTRVDALLGSAFNRQVFDPPMGAVETILASGRLDLMENRSLVAELTRWAALVEDLNEDERAAVNHFYQTLYPYLAAHLNIQDLDKGIPYPGGLPWPQQQTDAYLLVPSRDFHNAIYVHWVLYWNVDTRIPAVQRALDRITEMTSSELGS